MIFFSRRLQVHWPSSGASLWTCRLTRKTKWLHRSVVCLATGPRSLPNPLLHRVRSSASSFSFQYPLFSLRSYTSCLSLYPRPSLLSFPLFFLHWRVLEGSSYARCDQSFLLCIVCSTFLSSLTLSNTSFLKRSVQLIICILLQHHFSKLSRYFWFTFRSDRVSAPFKAMLQM